jgi:hypothetical protein
MRTRADPGLNGDRRGNTETDIGIEIEIKRFGQQELSGAFFYISIFICTAAEHRYLFSSSFLLYLS